jgi:tetratricopeptide (TPR) repeat protein
MNFKSSAAVLTVLLATCSIATTAEPVKALANGLLFPESVERAMMGQAAAAEHRLRTIGTLTTASSSFGFVPDGPIEGFFEKPNPAETNPRKPAVKEEEPATPAKNPASDEIPELNKALQLLQQGKLEEATKVLHAAAQAHPQLPSEYVMLFRIFSQTNQSNAARSCLEKAVVKMPSDPEPWLILGEVAIEDKRLSEAELDLEKAKKLITGYSNEKRKQLLEQQLLKGLARIAESRDNPAEAKARLEEYLNKSPDDLDALQRLADMAFCMAKRKGNTADGASAAYDVLKRVKEIDKRNAARIHRSEQLPPAFTLLIKLLEKHDRDLSAKDAPRIERLLRDALDVDADNLNLRAIAWHWALTNGHTAFAQQQADAVLRLEAADRARPAGKQKWPDSTFGEMVAGETALWKQQWANAENHFQVVYKLSPNDFSVRNALALALAGQNIPAKKEKALEMAYGNYQSNRDNNNNNVEAAATLSWVYFRLEKFDLASAAMDAIVHATGGNIHDPNTATYLAYILCHDDNGHNGKKYKASQILDTIIKSRNTFRMKPEALELYEKVKNEQPPK